MPIIQTVIQGGGGQTPTGTKSITAKGVYDVTDFALADVNVPTTAPAHYIEKTVDANGILRGASLFINLNGVKDIGDYVFANAFYNSSISSADMSSIQSLTGSNCCSSMFYGCKNLTSVDLSSLKTINGNSSCTNMFSSCPRLLSMNFPSLTSVTGNQCCNGMFSACNSMTELNFPVLKSINSASCMSGLCSNSIKLQTVRFSALDVMVDNISASYLQMFAGCFLLKDVYFSGLKSTTFATKTNQIQNIFSTATGRDSSGGCTIHFPSNFDPSDPNHTFDASTLAGYPTFGGNASYIHLAFDLPATE